MKKKKPWWIVLFAELVSEFEDNHPLVCTSVWHIQHSTWINCLLLLKVHLHVSGEHFGLALPSLWGQISWIQVFNRNKTSRTHRRHVLTQTCSSYYYLLLKYVGNFYRASLNPATRWRFMLHCRYSKLSDFSNGVRSWQSRASVLLLQNTRLMSVSTCSSAERWMTSYELQTGESKHRQTLRFMPI